MWINTFIALCLNSALNVKAVVSTFKQEKDLIRAFFVIVKLLVILAKVRLKLYRSLHAGTCATLQPLLLLACLCKMSPPRLQ